MTLLNRFNRIFKVLLLGVIVAIYNQPGYAQSTDEKKLKSVYLVNFARFTTWQSDDAKLVNLCVFKESDIYENIIGLSGFKLDESRVIRVVANPGDISQCQMVYWDDASIRYRNKPPGNQTLEVTDSQLVFEQGIEVLMYLNKNKLRFYISEISTNRSEFKLSSKLLRLSKMPKQLLNQKYGYVYAYSQAWKARSL